MNTLLEIPKPLKYLCVEDEPNMLDDLLHRVRAGAAASVERSRVLIGDREHRATKITVEGTDNLAEAQKAVKSGQCDVLLLDYRVKANKNSKKSDTVTCAPLLKDIGDSGIFIPIVAHTAFVHDLMLVAKEKSLEVDTVSKALPNSLEIAVEKIVQVGGALASFQLQLQEMLAVLAEAVESQESDELIDQQECIVSARRILAGLELPHGAPFDYARAILTLRSTLARTSSVASPSLGVQAPSREFLSVVSDLVARLVDRSFCFRTHGVQAFSSLLAFGYDVLMRCDDGTF